MIPTTIDNTVSNLAVALVHAEQISISSASDELRAYCDHVAKVAANSDGEPRRSAVRSLLRLGGFKPAGRSKPAQEYLLRTVSETGGLPAIWNAVDLINAVSLESGLPISLISLYRIKPPLVLKYGSPGEKFVFNGAGQEIDVSGLICLCTASDGDPRPVGSPVKDSLEAKVVETDRNVLACVYLPADEVTPSEANQWAVRLADGFARWCGAARTEHWLLPSTHDRGGD